MIERKNTVRSILWNLWLLSAGGLLYALGIKAVAQAQGFVTGGFFGVGLLIYYTTNLLSPAAWYFILNIPIFILGWVLVSRRFFWYSLYGMVFMSLAVQFITLQLPIDDRILAAVAGGAVCGAGLGIILRSLGSDGGLSIIAVILHQKYNIRIGQFGFAFNCLLFAASFYSLDTDLVLYSMIMAFLVSVVADHFMALFNQRKAVFIISRKCDIIADRILNKLHRGATYLYGRGAYTGEDKIMLMVVVNNYQLKRLEEAVFAVDPDAFVVVEDTFNVLGTGFSKRKVY